MSKYCAVYKCPLCGNILKYGEPTEIPYDALPKVLARVVSNQIYAGDPYLYKAPLHVPHYCPNGNAGLTLFAGFVISV